MGIKELVGSGSPFVEILASDVRFVASGEDGLYLVRVGHRVVEDVDVDDSGRRLSWAVVVLSGTYAQDFLVHESGAFRSGGPDKDKLSVGGRQGREHRRFHRQDVDFLGFVHDDFRDRKPSDVAGLVVERTEMATGTRIGILDVVFAVLVEKHSIGAVLGLEGRHGLEHVVLYDVGRGLLEGYDYRVVVRKERFLD